MTAAHWWILAWLIACIGWGLTIALYRNERKWRLRAIEALETVVSLQKIERLKLIADELAELENEERNEPDNDQVPH